jgi:hypothetical protein
MTIENQIAELLAQAEPLRALDDDDEAKEPLRLIVDRINALRAEQASGKAFAAAHEDLPKFEVIPAPGEALPVFEHAPVRRKPGPKPKAAE